MGEMRVMGPEGDLKVVWDRNKQDEVDAAKHQYEELTKKGYIAFSVNRKGEKDEKMSKFDPEEGMIILVPMLKGG